MDEGGWSYKLPDVKEVDGRWMRVDGVTSCEVSARWMVGGCGWMELQAARCQQGGGLVDADGWS